MKSFILKTAILATIGLRVLASPLHVQVDIEVGLDVEEKKSALYKAVHGGRQQVLETDPPVVTLPYEKHQASSSANDFYWNFANIPFAKPPLGDLRFQAAQPLDEIPESDRPLNKGETEAICPQGKPGWVEPAQEFLSDYFNISKLLPTKWRNEINPEDYKDFDPTSVDPRESEDCLTLDVMVPKRAFKASEEILHPVMVWFFGGGYVTGSKTLFGTPDGLFAAASYLVNATDEDSSEDIIFVATNYRLGAFGWLSGDIFEGGEPRGFENAGLSDQLAALNWVKNNIEKFGGDPDRVTVAGESAGASSILHHITSNAGRRPAPPFRRAILQSPAFFPDVDPGKKDKVFTNFLNATGAKDLSELRSKDTKVLMEANARVSYYSDYGQFAFGPVIDDTYVPSLPGILLKTGFYHNRIDIMVAHNENEGTLFTPPWLRSKAVFRAHILKIFPKFPSDFLSEVIDELYPITNFPDGRIQLPPVMNALADVANDCNEYYLAKAFPRSFRYFFNMYPGFHGQDAGYTFYPYSQGGPLTAVDEQAKRLQRYMTAFIKFGQPNDNEKDPEWESWDVSDQVMRFGDGKIHLNPPYGPGPDLTVGMGADTINHDKCDFWEMAPYWSDDYDGAKNQIQQVLRIANGEL